eukprot:3625048-Rhodomonas_salina.1
MFHLRVEFGEGEEEGVEGAAAVESLREAVVLGALPAHVRTHVIRARRSTDSAPQYRPETLLISKSSATVCTASLNSKLALSSTPTVPRLAAVLLS